MVKRIGLGILCCQILLGLMGCNPDANKNASNSGGDSTSNTGPAPVFTLAWSEYPSWSVYGVADKYGLLDASQGGMGEIEKKWNVDIVLNLAEYDPCIGQYGANAADAVCITNIDILAPSLKRASVAILPTSTSVGGDACLVVGIDNLDALQGKPTYGLEKSVSQYAFERVLEVNGKDPKAYTFTNLDPGAAATAMQASQADMQSIMVWNPFVMRTLRMRKEAKTLFDSSSIPEEIIDMVVIGKDSLAKPGGKRFAFAILDAFYSVNQMLADAKTHDDALVSLGEKFGNLSLEDMETVVQQTRFYDAADKGLALLEGQKFRGETMPHVIDFCVSHEMCETKPSFGFEDDTVQLNFDLQFLRGIRDGIDPASVK